MITFYKLYNNTKAPLLFILTETSDSSFNGVFPNISVNLITPLSPNGLPSRHMVVIEDTVKY